MSGERVRGAAIAIVLLTAGSTALFGPGAGASSCEHTVVGTVEIAGQPLEDTVVEVHDLVWEPATENETDPNTPSENRDAVNRVFVASGRTADDGSFSICVDRSDDAIDTEWKTLDLVLVVRADSGPVEVLTPPLEQVVLSLVAGPRDDQPDESRSRIYTALSPEHRNVDRGVVDLGTFRPVTPEFYPYSPETDVDSGSGDSQDLCITDDDGELVCVCVPGEGTDCDPGEGFPTAHPVQDAFELMALFQGAAFHVGDLHDEVYPDDDRGVGHVRVWVPYDHSPAGGTYTSGQITLDGFGESIAYHEYGHHVENRFAPTTPSGSHGCGTQSDANDAWSGGFAWVLGPLVTGDTGLSLSCGNIEDGGGHDEGQNHENNVAATLWDLTDGTADDAYDGSQARLWSIFADPSAAYTDYKGFHNLWALTYPGDADAIQAVACDNGIDVGCL